MIKKISLIVVLLCNSAVFACSTALPTDDINFCSSFKAVATCYCTSSGLPSSMCQDMNALYYRMIGVFGSLQSACAYQGYTSAQDCINNWSCYLYGGVDSTGRSCSSTQRACQ